MSGSTTAQLLIKTTNSGQNWFTLLNGLPAEILRKCFFTSADTGWAIRASQILKSTNGGINLYNQPYNYSTTTLRDMFFLNSSTGWVIGNNGLILYTTDGGGLISNINENTNHINDYIL
jgi:photosystem II stability/assembly factor-like uncharacterized protein